MLKLWFVILGILYGAMRGIVESIVMYQPGCRDHPWFDSWYHWLSTGEAFALAATAITAFCWFRKQKIRYVADMLKIAAVLAGLMFLLWEGFEISYYFGRMGQVVFGHENFLGMRAIDNSIIVGCIHGLRIILGLVFLKLGK